MKEELHLFILWENALYKKEDIMKDINEKFEILNVYNITWSKEKFSENLSRFYGTKLPNGSQKEKHCGNGTFLLVIVIDKNPVYDYRDTTAGRELVNINMFDSKSKFRELTGGGHRVHCTNSVYEVNHDLTLLLGKNASDYLSKLEKEKREICLNQDLVGANGFNNIEDAFYLLNNCSNYAILRNYENLPNEVYLKEHNDIDILCDSRENVAYILNAKKVQEEDTRSQYRVKLKNMDVNFDFRFIGDDYYCFKMEKELLENRVFNKKGFFTLSSEDYFYSLLYHALIQKLDFTKEYKNRLMKMNKSFSSEISNSYEKSLIFLKEWMLKKEYIATRPNDKTVIYNHNMLEYLEPFIYRKKEDLLYKENKSLKLENNILKEKLNDVNSKLNVIINSRSWKFTQIIRKIIRR